MVFFCLENDTKLNCPQQAAKLWICTASTGWPTHRITGVAFLSFQDLNLDRVTLLSRSTWKEKPNNFVGLPQNLHAALGKYYSNGIWNSWLQYIQPRSLRSVHRQHTNNLMTYLWWHYQSLLTVCRKKFARVLTHFLDNGWSATITTDNWIACSRWKEFRTSKLCWQLSRVMNRKVRSLNHLFRANSSPLLKRPTNVLPGMPGSPRSPCRP